MQALVIALGGALGSLMRYWVSGGVHSFLGRDFPYGTLTVNVVGSLFIGLLAVLFQERWGLDSQWRALLMVGFMGAFTTFSTFSLETLELLERSEFIKAGLNVLLNVAVCITAAWVGILLGRTTL